MSKAIAWLAMGNIYERSVMVRSEMAGIGDMFQIQTVDKIFCYSDE